MEKCEQITSCPRCDAGTEEQAHTMCYGADDCPMCVADDWHGSLARLNEIAQANQALAAELGLEYRQAENNVGKRAKFELVTGGDGAAQELTDERAMELLTAQYGEETAELFASQIREHGGCASVSGGIIRQAVR